MRWASVHVPACCVLAVHPVPSNAFTCYEVLIYDTQTLAAQYAAAARAKQAGRPLVLAAVEPDRGRESDAGEGAPVGGDAVAARLRKRKKDPRRPSQVSHPCCEL